MRTPTFIICLAAVLLPCLSAKGQNSSDNNSDSDAEKIVNNYFNILNYDALRKDSILYIETIIYKRSNPTDTAIMKRWFLPPNRFRAELWHNDTLIEGCYSNGRDVFRNVKTPGNGWDTVSRYRYYEMEPGFDFRGPLYHWKADGSTLTFSGEWKYNGADVLRVKVETPMKYTRYLLFEKESGLLFLIEETNEFSEYTNHQAYDHPDLHAFHEYQPFGDVILPSTESYQMYGDMVFHFSRHSYIPLDMNIFLKN